MKPVIFFLCPIDDFSSGFEALKYTPRNGFGEDVKELRRTESFSFAGED